MTYSGLSTLFLRMIGFLAIAGVLFSIVPAMLASCGFAPVLLLTGAGLVPGVIMIIASKPLGKLLAAGIE